MTLDTVLQVTPDRFEGLHCELRTTLDTENVHSEHDISVGDGQQFHGILQQCLETWKAQGVRGVWVKVPRSLLETTEFIQSLLRNGFELHHAQKDYVMLNTWLPDPEIDPNLMPNYASHYIGVGGLLVNSRDEILVVAEKYSFRKTHKLMWKLPGGLVDPYERISTAAEREVFEETGIRSRFEHISCFRHNPKWLFGKGDLYFVCTLRLLDSQIPEPKPDEKELYAAKWIKIDEFLGSSNSWVTNQQFVALALSRSNCSIGNPSGIREYVGSGKLGDHAYTHEFYAFGSDKLDQIPAKSLDQLPKEQSLPEFLKRTDNFQRRSIHTCTSNVKTRTTQRLLSTIMKGIRCIT